MSSTDFSKTASFHDLIASASGRDVAAESASIAALARELAPSGDVTLLDAAAGTGAYLLELARLGFTVAGIESDMTALQIARSRNVPLDVASGSIANFERAGSFGVAIALRGALAAARDAERLASSVANLAASLAPGGIAIVEPYLSPDAYVVGAIEAIHVDEPRVKISRVIVTKRVSNLAILDYHYLIATNRGVERHFERIERGLYGEAAYRKAFEAAGLSFRLHADPAFPLGLIVGTQAA